MSNTAAISIFDDHYHLLNVQLFSFSYSLGILKLQKLISRTHL